MFGLFVRTKDGYMLKCYYEHQITFLSSVLKSTSAEYFPYQIVNSNSDRLGRLSSALDCRHYLIQMAKTFSELLDYVERLISHRQGVCLFLISGSRLALQRRCFCKHSRRYSRVSPLSRIIAGLSFANWVMADGVSTVFSQLFPGSVSLYSYYYRDLFNYEPITCVISLS